MAHTLLKLRVKFFDNFKRIAFYDKNKIIILHKLEPALHLLVYSCGINIGKFVFQLCHGICPMCVMLVSTYFSFPARHTTGCRPFPFC